MVESKIQLAFKMIRHHPVLTVGVLLFSWRVLIDCFTRTPAVEGRRTRSRLLFHRQSPVLEVHNGSLETLLSVVHSNDDVFTLFYAPWCAQSVRVAKNFEQVAKKLNGEVKFVAVNCWLDSGSCRQRLFFPFFPRVIVYQNRRTDRGLEYFGGLRAWQLENAVHRVSRPTRYITSREEFQQLTANSEAVVVGHFLSQHLTSEMYKTFHLAANEALFLTWPEAHDLDGVRFVVITDSSLGHKLNLDHPPSITRVSALAGRLEYRGELNSTELKTWSKQHPAECVTGLVPTGDLSPLLSAGPLVLLFIPFSATQVDMHLLQNSLATFRRVALRYCRCSRTCSSLLVSKFGCCQEDSFPEGKVAADVHKENLQYCPSNPVGSTHCQRWRQCHCALIKERNLQFRYIDSVIFKSLGKSLGLQSVNSIALVIVDREAEETFILEKEVLSAKKMASFIQRFIHGNLTAHRNSAPLPEESCPTATPSTSCLQEVTADTFQEQVVDNDYDVFLLFYMTTCTFCNVLVPDLLQTARHYWHVAKLKFAKMNALTNDLPQHLQAELVPSLVLFPADNKSHPLLFPRSAPLDASHFNRFLRRYAPSISSSILSKHISSAIERLQEDSKGASDEIRELQLQTSDLHNLAVSAQQKVHEAQMQVSRQKEEKRILIGKVDKGLETIGKLQQQLWLAENKQKQAVQSWHVAKELASGYSKLLTTQQHRIQHLEQQLEQQLRDSCDKERIASRAKLAEAQASLLHHQRILKKIQSAQSSCQKTAVALQDGRRLARSAISALSKELSTLLGRIQHAVKLDEDKEYQLSELVQDEERSWSELQAMSDDKQHTVHDSEETKRLNFVDD